MMRRPAALILVLGLSCCAPLALVAGARAAHAQVLRTSPQAADIWRLRARRLLAGSRDGAITPAMAEPPAITVGAANAGSTVVTDATALQPNIAANDDRLTLISGAFLSDAGGGNFQPEYLQETNNRGQTGWGLGFNSDAEACAVEVRDGGDMNVRVRLDGKWAGPAQILPTNGYSNFYEVRWDLGAGKGAVHHWEVFFGNGSQVRGVNCGKAAGSTAAANPYRVWPAPYLDEPKVMVRTDSYGSAASVDARHNPREPFVYQIADLMGWPDIVDEAVAGQGLINPSVSASQTAIQQIADVQNLPGQDLFIMALCYNDYGQTESAEQAAAEAYLAAVRGVQPDAYIAVFGCWRTPIHGSAVVNAGVRAAVAAIGDPHMTFIDTQGGSAADPAWQDTAGGNAALYMGPDNIHPNAAGDLYLGRRMARRLTDWLRTRAEPPHR